MADTGRETPTCLTKEPDRQPRGRLTLLVIGAGPVMTYPLPAEGEVTIGRGSRNTVSLDDSSASREHALLRIGTELEIIDLGSRHGTRLREQRLEANTPTAVGLGDAIHVGSSLLVVQAAFTEKRAGRFWSHDIFEARLQEECDRLRRVGRPFALVRARVPPAHTTEAESALSTALRADDVACVYAPGDYEILLIETSADTASEVVAQIEAAGRDVGRPIQTRLACAPRDGRSPEELIAFAGGQLLPGGPSETAARTTVLTPAMQRLQPLLERIAPSTINVLILGETGVGKEILAETIHAMSPRAAKPLLRVNCAALAETLLESELFGHEKGAFTGAERAKPGLLENTDGGTVLLDEVGELPPNIQVKLLRVLEERQVTRVGGLEPRTIDVRFVAATNRDLELQVDRGAFRKDLYFRLNGIALVMPPLRDRVEDIPELARAFVADFARTARRAGVPALSDEALAALMAYEWPGNVRELRNVIERAVLLCEDRILPEHLSAGKLAAPISHVPVRGWPSVERPSAVASPADESTDPHDGQSDEERRIREVLEQCGGNQTRAARILGISRRTLGVKLDRYGMPRPRRPPAPDDG